MRHPLLVSLVLFTGCAHTVQQRMDVLKNAKSAECPNDLDKLEEGSPKNLIPNEWIEGELPEGRCTSAVSRRSSWDLFRFLPKDTRADLEIRVAVLAKGLGFRGEHSMIIPYVTLLEGMRRSSGAVRLLSIRADRDPARGDTLVYLYSMNGLKPGKKTGVLITADLSQAGKKVENAVAAHLSADFPLAVPVLVGPFGAIEVRLNAP